TTSVANGSPSGLGTIRVGKAKTWYFFWSSVTYSGLAPSSLSVSLIERGENCELTKSATCLFTKTVDSRRLQGSLQAAWNLSSFGLLEGAASPYSATSFHSMSGFGSTLCATAWPEKSRRDSSTSVHAMSGFNLVLCDRS